MTEEELIKQFAEKIKGKRQPTLFGLLAGVVFRDLIRGWALMVLLGIVASATAAPGLALGYWMSLGTYELWSLVRERKNSR